MSEENQISTPVNTAPASQPEKFVDKFKRIASQKKVWVTAVVVAGLVLLAGIAYYYKSAFVAASVNGHYISRLSVVKELERQGGKDTLDMLINKQLVDSEAKAKHITVSQDDINKEMQKYENQFNVNGNTLDDTLAANNLTREDLKNQIVTQLELQKILGDKVSVTDDEVASYIKDNKLTLPKGQEAEAKAQIKDQLQQQKLSDQSNQLISELRAKANIKRFVNY